MQCVYAWCSVLIYEYNEPKVSQVAMMISLWQMTHFASQMKKFSWIIRFVYFNIAENVHGYANHIYYLIEINWMELLHTLISLLGEYYIIFSSELYYTHRCSYLQITTVSFCHLKTSVIDLKQKFTWTPEYVLWQSTIAPIYFHAETSEYFFMCRIVVFCEYTLYMQ